MGYDNENYILESGPLALYVFLCDGRDEDLCVFSAMALTHGGWIIYEGDPIEDPKIKAVAGGENWSRSEAIAEIEERLQLKPGSLK